MAVRKLDLMPFSIVEARSMLLRQKDWISLQVQMMPMAIEMSAGVQCSTISWTDNRTIDVI